MEEAWFLMPFFILRANIRLNFIEKFYSEINIWIVNVFMRYLQCIPNAFEMYVFNWLFKESMFLIKSNDIFRNKLLKSFFFSSIFPEKFF